MVPLYRLTGGKCNSCTYIVSSAPNGPLYMLTGKKCNFCTYIVTGAPNGDWGKVVTGAPTGPPIHADWQKVQFLHLICYCCSKWSPYTG